MSEVLAQLEKKGGGGAKAEIITKSVYFNARSGGTLSITGTTKNSVISVYAFLKFMGGAPTATLNINGVDYSIPQTSVSSESYGYCASYKLEQACQIGVPFTVTISKSAVSTSTINTMCGFGALVMN